MAYHGTNHNCLLESTKTELTESDEAMEEQRSDNEEDEDYQSVIRNVATSHSLNPLDLSTFSTGGELQDTTCSPAVYVEGVGRVAYPLCKEQTVTLLSVSSPVLHEKCKKAGDDINRCRVWQIDGHLVQVNQEWLSESLPKLVSHVCTKLGIDAIKMNIQANLYKMLLYEEGGHFEKHRDTEKEPGMFGSLLIQLPAEYEGGHLVVEHEKQTKRFEFDKKSADKGYYTAFYAGYEQTLEPVTEGRRLALVFNLVADALTPVAPLPTPSAQGFEERLAAATRDWMDDETGVQKFAVPLAHKYAHTNMTFAGLKGDDRKTLNLLQDACDPTTSEKLFSVHLALVTRHTFGPEYNDREEDSDAEKVTFKTEGWVGPTGPAHLGSLAVDFKNEIITANSDDLDYEDEAIDAIFGRSATRSSHDKYNSKDRYGRDTIERWYLSVVLVIWPAQRDFDITLTSNFEQALEMLQTTRLANPVDYTFKLTRLLAFLAKSSTCSWQPARLLSFTEAPEQAKIMVDLCCKLKLSTADVAAIVAEISKHGWTELSKVFQKVLSSQSPATMTVLLSELKQLIDRHSDNPTFVDAVPVVSAVAWNELLEVLVAKVVQPLPVTTITSTHSSFGRFYAPMLPVPPHAPTANEEEEWVTVAQFVVAHCTLQDQERVAAHLGSSLKLRTLNLLVAHCVDGPFQAKLRDSAVQLCIGAVQSPEDLTAVLLDAVKGNHVALMTSLQPTLLRFCDNPVLFRAVFALPEVLAELTTESALGLILESSVQARITALKPHITAPPFSWRMPANQINSDDHRVKPFLTSDQQSTVLTGFQGVKRARGWMHGHFGYGNRSRNGISAEANGTGPRATVTLTKSVAVHEAAVQRCKENATELQGLRQLLAGRARDGDITDVADSISATTDNNVGSGDRDEMPALKRARVEPEIIVIDD